MNKENISRIRDFLNLECSLDPQRNFPTFKELTHKARIRDFFPSMCGIMFPRFYNKSSFDKREVDERK